MIVKKAWDCYSRGAHKPSPGRRPVVQMPVPGSRGAVDELWGAYLDSPRYPQRRDDELVSALSELGQPPAVFLVGGEDDLRDRSLDRGPSLVADLRRYGKVSTVLGSDDTAAAGLEADPSSARQAFVWAMTTFNRCLVAPRIAEEAFARHFRVLSALYSLWFDSSRIVPRSDRSRFNASIQEAALAYGCSPRLDELEPAVAVALLSEAQWVIRKDGSDGEFAFLVSKSRRLVERVRDAVLAP